MVGSGLLSAPDGFQGDGLQAGGFGSAPGSASGAAPGFGSGAAPLEGSILLAPLERQNVVGAWA